MGFFLLISLGETIQQMYIHLRWGDCFHCHHCPSITIPSAPEKQAQAQYPPQVIGCLCYYCVVVVFLTFWVCYFLSLTSRMWVRFYLFLSAVIWKHSSSVNCKFPLRVPAECFDIFCLLRVELHTVELKITEFITKIHRMPKRKNNKLTLPSINYINKSLNA